MWHPTADQLTAAALPGEPDDPVVTAHLRDCATCAAEADALRRTVGHARHGMTLDVHPPPPAPVWDGILARLDDDDAPPAAAPPRRSRAVVGAGIAAALVAIAAVVAVVLGVATPSPGAPPATARVVLVAAQPGVTGSVEGRPGGMHVEVTVPAGVPAGHDLEVWDTATGAPRSLGVLVADGARTHWQGDLALPAPCAMPPLDVSLEPVGAGPQHSGISLAHTP